MEVIVKAVQKLGAKAEKSGRNDILIDGKKFSGNAFYEQEQHCYHHGTLMMNVNKEMLSKYLTVSKEKLQSKGVDSVKSRVTNLVDYIPDLTLEALKKALREAFEEVYGLTSNECKMEDLDQKEIEMRTKHFSSWDWRFGRKIDFQYEISKRFSWGQMNIHFQVDKEKIADVNVYSDSLKPMMIEKLQKYLKGIRYHKINICSVLRLYWADDKQEEAALREVFPDRILSNEDRCLRRDSVDGMHDALLDLYCLASTRKIIGSYFSSFTDIAADMHKIPKVIAGE